MSRVTIQTQVLSKPSTTSRFVPTAMKKQYTFVKLGQLRTIQMMYIQTNCDLCWQKWDTQPDKV